jgi:hypothetical protein
MSADWSDVFPSSPIAGETAATVELVGADWRADEDWQRFEDACRRMTSGPPEDYVNPNMVRAYLSNAHGLTIEPRRYSAFWHRASKGKDAFLVADGWVENTDRKGGNAGKPLRRYRLRESS